MCVRFSLYEALRQYVVGVAYASRCYKVPAMRPDYPTGILRNGCKFEIPIRIRSVVHSRVADLANSFFWSSRAYPQRGIEDIAAITIEDRNSPPSTKSLTALSRPYGESLYSSDPIVDIATWSPGQ